MHALSLLLLAPAAQDHLHETFADNPGESPKTAQEHAHDQDHEHELGALFHKPEGFTPDFGAVIDAIADQTRVDGSQDDGFDLRLRSLEMSVHSQIDANTYGYALLVADQDEVVLEEALVQYTGLPGETSLRAGRFFADFGTQMQLHVHELPYPERPGVLREYLGRELAGTGVQIDHWLDSDQDNAYRLSLGVFDSLLAEHGHGEEGAGPIGAEAFSPDRSDLGDLSFTARVAGVHHVGEGSLFEWGLSLREIPDLGFELDSSGFEVGGLSNRVLGADLTYRTHTASGAGWSFGGEGLWFDGDLGAEVNESGTPGDASDDTLTPFGGDVFGSYLWVERTLDERNSLGVLYSTHERPEPTMPETDELTLYYSRQLSKSSRLRFAVTQFDRELGSDETAFLIQFTNYIGTHAHAGHDPSGHLGHGH